MFIIDSLDLIVSFSVTAFILCLALLLAQISRQIPPDEREFMDPLPSMLEFIWPLVRIVAYYGCSLLPYTYVKNVEKRLRRNGMGYMMLAEEFLALRVVAAFFVLTLGYMLLELLGEWNNILFLVLPLTGFFYPDIWMRDIRKKQVDAILRTLPTYLDFICMAVHAGLNFSGAIEQARKKAPAGPLVIEFGVVLRDLRAGIPRSKALERMAQRLEIHEVTSFVNAVVHAEKMGSTLAGVLQIQAEQRRNERFQRAEKKAMEAPVKLVGPLVLFIFPTTFIVLAFPIIMKFMQQGLF
ncbi:MAG: type II secretion system F family protein [Thermodesulfobacteriota bacterium]|nr:type II secretion system F family protein [Thermodesulfobacteriota bacterium]